MSAKTKIILLKKRELIYTALFLFFGIVFFILMALMFRPSAAKPKSLPKQNYTSGIYTVPLTLNESAMEIAVRIDHDQINSIHMQNLSDSVAAMYPLMQPALDKIALQVCDTQSTANIYYDASTQYTSQMLLSAINKALDKASRH